MNSNRRMEKDSRKKIKGVSERARVRREAQGSAGRAPKLPISGPRRLDNKTKAQSIDTDNGSAVKNRCQYERASSVGEAANFEPDTADSPSHLRSNKSDDIITRRTSVGPKFSALFKDLSEPALGNDRKLDRARVPGRYTNQYRQAVLNNDPQSFRLLMRPSDAAPEMQQHSRDLKNSRTDVGSNSKDDLVVLNFSTVNSGNSDALNMNANASDETVRPTQSLNSKKGLEELIYNYSPKRHALLLANTRAERDSESGDQERTAVSSYGSNSTLDADTNLINRSVGTDGNSKSATTVNVSTEAGDTLTKIKYKDPSKRKKSKGGSVDSTFDNVDTRTKEIMMFLRYCWIVNIIGVMGITYILTFVGPFNYSDANLFTLKTCWSLAWLIPLPLMSISFVGLLIPFRSDKERYNRKNTKPRRFDNMYVVIVARGDNRDAIMRSWNTHRHLEQIPKVRVHILTDEPYYFDNSNCFACPKSFVCRAMYKARALEWYRRTQKLTEYDWVLHLDEESIVDVYTINRCIEFIKYSPHLIGQGVILYNQYNFWKNWIFTAADVIRVGDDLGRFHLQYELYHRSFIGAHGSFLLNNGKLENDITWELSSFTEDYQFAIISSQRKYTCGQIDGIIREQSPQKLIDFMRQRRRWFCGISRVKLLKSKFWALSWFLGSFSVPIFAVSLSIGMLFPDMIPRWIGYLINLNFAILVVLTILGSAIQSYDARVGFFKGTGQLILTLLLMPVSAAIESLSVFYSLVKPPKSFDVIKK